MAENRLIQLDLGTRAADVIPLTTTEMDQIPKDRLSPDGRIVAICKPPAEAEAGDAKKGGLVLWDTIAKKRLAFLPGLEPPFAFSDDGRSLAVAVTPDTTGHLAIVDLGTLTTRETQVPISSRDPGPGCLSDDGSYFARFVFNGRPPFQADEVDLVCWNVATGRVVVRQWVAQIGMRTYGDAAFARGGRYLFLFPWAAGDRPIRCYDMADEGRQVARFPQDRNSAGLSPDRRLLWTLKYKETVPLVQRAIQALGLSRAIPLEDDAYGELIDAETGNSRGVVFAGANGFTPSPELRWAPDGRSFAVPNPPDANLWHVWDVPPRKPLTWLALAAAILALPLAGLAWRRSRRLRRGAA
jgi:hypothetical protein